MFWLPPWLLSRWELRGCWLWSCWAAPCRCSRTSCWSPCGQIELDRCNIIVNWYVQHASWVIQPRSSLTADPAMTSCGNLGLWKQPNADFFSFFPSPSVCWCAFLAGGCSFLSPSILTMMMLPQFSQYFKSPRRHLLNIERSLNFPVTEHFCF